MSEPRDHHYVPQFFLRNFATDAEKRKVTTVAKNGNFAIWAERSIEHLGFERDLYVHLRAGVPVSVESAINSRIETPISQSDTWTKIASGRTDALDRSDKPILYALIRHLEARTPHYFATQMELANLAALPDSAISFTDEERQQYAEMRSDPDLVKEMFDYMSSSLGWTERTYKGCGLTIIRSKIPVRTSSTPVLTIPAPPHPSLWLPLPGMIPFQYVLTLNPTTIASLVLADFDDAFLNIEAGVDFSRAINRCLVGQFGHFKYIRHLLTSTKSTAAAFIEDMAYFRELLKRKDIDAPAIRRVSNELRRLLIDTGGDLEKIAAPRIGRIHITAPYNNPYYRKAEKHTFGFFASGGVTLFGATFRGIIAGDGNHPVPNMSKYPPDVTEQLTTDNFLSQKVLCLKGIWSTRRSLIKYIANFSHGVHSGTATNEYEKQIERIRRVVTFGSPPMRRMSQLTKTPFCRIRK